MPTFAIFLLYVVYSPTGFIVRRLNAISSCMTLCSFRNDENSMYEIYIITPLMQRTASNLYPPNYDDVVRIFTTTYRSVIFRYMYTIAPGVMSDINVSRAIRLIIVSVEPRKKCFCTPHW